MFTQQGGTESERHAWDMCSVLTVIVENLDRRDESRQDVETLFDAPLYDIIIITRVRKRGTFLNRSTPGGFKAARCRSF